MNPLQFTKNQSWIHFGQVLGTYDHIDQENTSTSIWFITFVSHNCDTTLLLSQYPRPMSKHHLITTQQITNNSLQSKFYFLHTSEITSYENFFFQDLENLFLCYGSRQHSVSIDLTICKITSFQHTISSLQTVPDVVVSIHITINFHIAPRRFTKRKCSMLLHISA